MPTTHNPTMHDPSCAGEHDSAVSAFMDGEAAMHECLQAHARGAGVGLSVTQTQAWSEYHTIRRVLQGQPALAQVNTQTFLAQWRSQIGSIHLQHGGAAHQDQSGHVAADWLGKTASNDGHWRWAVAFAVLGLAVGLVWYLQPTSPALQQLAAEQPPQEAVVVRNAELDELLLAHRRRGGQTALQTSTGFIRGASLESAR